MARLMDNPAMVPSAVEEMLRYAPPINQFRRTATRDVEFGGQHIKEGDKIAMFYSSANRDEDVFANPDVFDIGRTPNEHLSFGIGTHVCLGNSLARVEIRAMFAALIQRFRSFELTGPVTRLRSNFVMGVTSMPMRLVPQRRAARIAI
jgi:cytochrome P450